MRAPEQLAIRKGSAYVYYAFDVGIAIELDKAERLLAATRKKPAAQEKKRQAKYFEFTPPPVRWAEECAVISVGPHYSTLTTAEMLLFDFGSVSVRFEIPIHGPISQIMELSVDLYENARLQDAAKVLVTKLMATLGGVIDKPALAPRVEDYCIFHFSEMTPRVSVNALLDEYVIPMTCILRAETSPPSDREAQEILNDRISYGSNDVTFMSWHGAVIFGENAEDIYAVLEFANLVLLELSYLDSNLDRSLDELYEFFAETRLKRSIFGKKSNRVQMRRISQLQIESAILFERITNALKLMGDDFQAKVFRLATRKMGLSSWDASITRKLQTLESVYQKISDTQGTRRMEAMEMVIIILFVISIFLSVYVSH